MPLRLLLIAIITFLTSTVSAQRLLEYVQDIGDPSVSSLQFNNKVLMLRAGQTYLDAYGDDDGIIRRYYPTVAGARLMFGYYSQPVIYNSQAWFVLHNATETFLYRFNGVTFTRLVIPGTFFSNPIVFGGNLYILSKSGTTVQLYRYNGSTVTAVSGGTIPPTGRYYLKVAGSYLYLIGQATSGSETYTVKRYNGTSFTTLPSFTFSNSIENISAVGSNAYINIGEYKLLYYNGTTLTTVFDMPGYRFHEVIWRGSLYYIPSAASEPTVVPLKRVTAGVATDIAMPAGTKIFHTTDIAVYNDALYFEVVYGTNDAKLLRYDGSFTEFFDIPEPQTQGGAVFTREANLVIQPRIVNPGPAYEYNGTVFTQLLMPDEKFFAGFLGSTTCNHLWTSLYYDLDDMIDPFRWALMKEPKGCPPPAELVIPDIFLDKWERFDINLWAQDRGWCWNEIIIDWGIEPCTPPDCPDPVFNLNIFDKNKELVFDKKIDKPSTLSIPLADNQRYSTKLTTVNKQDVFVFADNLVEKGIESIKMNMKPNDGFFNLSATTDAGVQVDLKVELLSKTGEVLWNKSFKAPFTTLITDKITTLGATMRFSIPDAGKNVITQLNTYPNPAKGQLYLQVKSVEIVTNAELSISTLLGQNILNRKINLPFNQPINLSNIKPGMYVMKIVTGKEVISKVIKIE